MHNDVRQLEIQLIGSAADGGAVRLDDLHQFLQQLVQTLMAVEKEISHSKKATTYYRVVSLSYSSPVRVAVEAVTETGDQDLAPIVVSRFVRQVQDVTSGKEPEGIDFTTLEVMQGLASGYKRHLSLISFASNNETIPLPSDFDVRVKRLLGNVYRTHGTFRGKLEAINLHADPCAIYIYPVAGPSKIRCTFKRGMIPNIKDLLEQNVDVYGIMKYRGNAPHPHEIEVESIKPLLPQEKLPKVDDIIGSMPNITGGKDVLSFLREIRDEEFA